MKKVLQCFSKAAWKFFEDLIRKCQLICFIKKTTFPEKASVLMLFSFFSPFFFNLQGKKKRQVISKKGIQFSGFKLL